MVTQTICLGCGKLVPVAPAFCVLCGDPLPLRMPVLVPTPGRHGQPGPTGGGKSQCNDYALLCLAAQIPHVSYGSSLQSQLSCV